MLATPSNSGSGDNVTKRISEGKDPDDVLATAVLLKLTILCLFAAFLKNNQVDRYRFS